MQYVGGLQSDRPRFVVNVRGATGDWFGGWAGDKQPEGDRYANADATRGRMVELIDRGEPATLLCHWPGLYTNGKKQGFGHCKRVVLALNARFGRRTVWMKMSEVARYWAAQELTRIERGEGRVTLTAPVACPGFTLRVTANVGGPPRLRHNGAPLPLAEARDMTVLKRGTWVRESRAQPSVLTCLGEAQRCSQQPKERTSMSSRSQTKEIHMFSRAKFVGWGCAILLCALSNEAFSRDIARVALSPGWATFGMVVPQGLATNALQVGDLQTQTDIKNRWPASRFPCCSCS